MQKVIAKEKSDHINSITYYKIVHDTQIKQLLYIVISMEEYNSLMEIKDIKDMKPIGYMTSDLSVDSIPFYYKTETHVLKKCIVMDYIILKIDENMTFDYTIGNIDIVYDL